MINIKDFIEESLQDKVKNDEKIITKFIEDNYNCGGDLFIKPIGNNKYEVSCLGYVRVKLDKLNKIESLTNDMFVWDKVRGDFSCGYCDKLKSLNGSPREVRGSFYCTGCSLLKSLKGCPEKVLGDFDCQDCDSIKSYKYAGQIGGRFFM